MKKLILVLALLALICPFMGMKLYLTNTSSSGQAQSDPNASLGGYRSTTELSATSMKNLFDDVSVVEALLGDTEYRMIDVYNDGTGTAYGVQLYMQTATSSSSTELDFGYSSTNQPHADAWNGEALSNESTAPASPSMSFSNYTKTSPLALGTIPASQSKRVCVRRTVTAGAPWTAHDLGRFGVRWGGVVTPPAGDTCGTGGLLFAWHCENADVTSGTPAGCSTGDSTATATNASISTATATPDAGDGDGSALFESESERYSFDLTSGDILNSSQGRITFRLRVHTWLNGATIFRGYGSDTNQILIGLYGTNRLKISYIGNGTSVVLYSSNNANGQLAADTWYLVTLRYRVGATDPSMSIQLDALTATTTNDDLTEINDTTGNLHFGGWDGGTCVWNLDDVHIYNTYAD